MEYISRYSLYAFENELRQGFLTVEGGHRVGVAGKVIMDKDKVKNIQYISSVNIRVSHEIIGCADSLLPYITKNRQVCHTLIISPPCCGKTTLIRDLIRRSRTGTGTLRDVPWEWWMSALSWAAVIWGSRRTIWDPGRIYWTAVRKRKE